jgi:hypothetical protein
MALFSWCLRFVFVLRRHCPRVVQDEVIRKRSCRGAIRDGFGMKWREVATKGAATGVNKRKSSSPPRD